MPREISIELLKAGDQTAFKQIFDLFHKRLCLFALGITTDDSAEDIVQEAFVKLWERKENFNTIDSIKAFLYLTVKNTCLNLYKHKQVIQKHSQSLTEMMDEISVDHKMVEAEVASQIRQALEQLPDGYRKVIYLGYFEGLSNQQAADHLNVSINTVKTQKVRGLRILRDFIKKLPYAFLFVYL